MLPADEQEATWFNFPPRFTIGGVAVELAMLRRTMESSPARDVVLNFEKCHWFDLLALSQLLTCLCAASRTFTAALHVVGPATGVLHFLVDWVVKKQALLKNPSVPIQVREEAADQVRWNAEEAPSMRRLAGAFLVGWRAIDVIEDHFPQVFWYMDRMNPESATRQAFDQHYEFSYGFDPTILASTSDRVWPYTVVHRRNQDDLIRRLNSEDLIAGPLYKYAGLELIASGLAANVVLFEPFDNVFEHAFEPQSFDDEAIIGMRIISPQAKRRGGAHQFHADELEWERAFKTRHVESELLEVAITDAGAGIPSTLRENFQDDAKYRKEHPEAYSALGRRRAWHLIKYAFEPHSTRRSTVLPGKRGLAWLKEVMSDAQGAVAVYSGGCCYVLADSGRGLKEVRFDSTNVEKAVGRQLETGTYIRLLIPIGAGGRQSTLARGPRWQPKSTGELFHTAPVIAGIALPKDFPTLAEGSDWEDVFQSALIALSAADTTLVALDLADRTLSRATLERFGEVFLAEKRLHGRLLLLNCSKHVTARLTTVLAFEKLRAKDLILPVFEAGMRLYWIGAPTAEEPALLELFRYRRTLAMTKGVLRLAKANGHYFFGRGNLIGLQFGVEDVEYVIRKDLGTDLAASLDERGAIHRGRFRLPLSSRTSGVFVEPHQILSDWVVSARLSAHLALLLRYRFRHLPYRRDEIRVLTATRIGRDISARMPAAFALGRFVYFDYHLLHRGKERVLQDLLQAPVIIVVDIVTTGSQVTSLIEACEAADAHILGIISFIDFSPGDVGATREFKNRNGRPIEHLTFWRSPQELFDPLPGDTRVDPETISIASTDKAGRWPTIPVAMLTGHRALRFLEDARALHHGHFDLMGHHNDLFVNLAHVLLSNSPAQAQILRSCEQAIRATRDGIPTAIVLYPDHSDANLLHGALEKRHRIALQVAEGKLQFAEARRIHMARSYRYWLSAEEIHRLTSRASAVYPGGYGVVIIDDGASSGDTILALQVVARQLKASFISAFVVTNRMSALHGRHHATLQRLDDADIAFQSFLHLDIPVYRRSDCPSCRDRDMLIRERQHAREQWFCDQLDLRINALESQTTLHPHQVPEDSGGLPSASIARFKWEPELFFPGPNQTIASRVAGIHTAISEGYPLLELLLQVVDSGSEVLLRMAALEVARRTDQQRVQGCEEDVIGALMRLAVHPRPTFQVIALDALYLTSPEALRGSIPLILQTALPLIENDAVLASLILLLRRQLSHRYAEPKEALADEGRIITIIDDAYARAPLGGTMRKAINRLNSELRGLPMARGGELPTIVGQMEKVFMTTRRRRHHLLYALSKYISDRSRVVSDELVGALDNTVMATHMAMRLARVTSESRFLKTEDLEQHATVAHDKARWLSRRVRAKALRTEEVTSTELRDALDAVTKTCKEIADELVSHITEPGKALETAWARFQEDLPSELVDAQLDVRREFSQSGYIACDTGLFRQIADNIFSNLRHALDSSTKSVTASVSLRFFGREGVAYVEVRCPNAAPPPDPIGEDTTARSLSRDAATYGGTQIVAGFDELGEPGWTEIWKFRSLEK